MKIGSGTRESTCTINSSKTLAKIFVALTIDCFTTITSLSRKNVNSTDISVGVCSTALKPISSIILKCSEGIKIKVNIAIIQTRARAFWRAEGKGSTDYGWKQASYKTPGRQIAPNEQNFK